MRKISRIFKESISRFHEEIRRKSYDILFNFFLIMYGLFATETIQRSMDQILGAGIMSMNAYGLFLGMWRILALLVEALLICIFFIHGSSEIIKLKFITNLFANYLIVFYTIYLSLFPWLSLHLARIFARIFIPDIPDAIADYFFIGAYILGLLLLIALLKIINGNLFRRRMHTRRPSH